ncbi:MAG TPA: hypothetical protein VFQ68_31870 [Streptosporangiaceae bacterium]|nr:hypothetical protein [Streptosporangiaceae bacterium]
MAEGTPIAQPTAIADAWPAALGGGDEGVEPGAGADVEDPLARFELAQREGLPTPAKDSTARSGSASSRSAS